jgi:heat shock protein beta
MAPALSRMLGASSVAALQPSPASSRGLPRKGRARAAGEGRRREVRWVRWLAARRRTVGVRCDAAVAEKPAREEETPGEEFKYQAEVGHRIIQEIILFSMPLHSAVANFVFRD